VNNSGYRIESFGSIGFMQKVRSTGKSISLRLEGELANIQLGNKALLRRVPCNRAEVNRLRLQARG